MLTMLFRCMRAELIILKIRVALVAGLNPTSHDTS